MSELFNKINQDLQKALKEKNELRLSVLRMMKSRVLYINARGDLPDAEVLKIIAKYGKELKETIEEMKRVNRPDSAAQSEKELTIVSEYLPKQLTDEEVEAAVKDAIAEVGATSVKEMGKVIKAVMSKHPGIDGGKVNQFVRELLK
ncbi:MAG: GatB/YqeY domain-containing protein [Candidatus Margulisiibacteriota bacterium]